MKPTIESHAYWLRYKYKLKTIRGTVGRVDDTECMKYYHNIIISMFLACSLCQ